MLREVLLALQGLSGDFFVAGDGKQHGGVWSAVEDSFHPSERVIVQRLCRVGASYRTVCNFVGDAAASSQRVGMYMRALANAMDRQVERYRNVLVNLEEELQSGKYPPLLSYVSNVVAEVRLPSSASPSSLSVQEEPLLDRLQSLIETIAERKVTGTRLLDLAMELAGDGSPRIRQAGTKCASFAHNIPFLNTPQDFPFIIARSI